MKRLPRGVAWLFAAIVALAFTACRERRTPLLLTATPWIGNAPLMVAQEQKLYGKTELRVVELSTDFDAWRGLIEGRAALTSGTLFDILRTVDHGVDLRVVMALDYSNGADGIVGREGITSVSDLVGKKVAVEKSTLTHFILIRALERAGITEDQVTIMNLATDEAVEALANGRVDAAALWEPLLTRALVPGRRLLFSSAEIPGEILDVIAVRHDTVRDRQSALVDIIGGFDRVTKSFAADPAFAQASAARLMDLSAEDARNALSRIEYVDLDKNAELFDRTSPQNIWTAYANATRFMKQHGMLHHPAPAPDDILEPGPIQRAIEARK